jgi:hypothetical protein
MNKQLIRDLAITGGIYDCICDPYDKLENGDPYSSVMIDLERFAEKIVKECIECADIVGQVNIASGYPNSTAHHVKQKIREHFGVDE